MRSRRSLCVEDDEVLGQPGLVLVEAADLDRAARRARWSPGSDGRTSARRTRRPAPRARRHSACAPIVNGTTRPPYRNSSQRIGRPNSSSPRPSSSVASQCICFGKARSRRTPPSSSGSVSTALLPRMPLVIREVLALRRRHARQLLERHALLPGEAERRRRRLPVRAERRGHRRAADRLVEIFLALGDLARRARSAAAAC